MSGCPSLGGGGDAAGIAQALRTLDCRTADTTAYAFGRLFGANGHLLPVLTGLLTLYVAFFAISLLTGRSRIGVSALTPRMLTLGLVMTFATSWAAYQNVVWTLVSGAPDQVATLLAGSHGSATTAFADHLDALFGAVADAAHQASVPGAPTETGITPAAAVVGGFSSSTALWICAMLLMLGTAGVLITSKIALAALLAIGPLFIVLALFDGTRGLFTGWLKAMTMFALVPLLTVLVGGGAIGALTPVVRDIAEAGGQPAARDVAVLFLGTCVYCALMVMVLKAAGTIVSGWRLGSSASLPSARERVSPPPIATQLPPTFIAGSGTTRQADDRVRHIVASVSPSGEPGASNVVPLGRGRSVSGQIVTVGGEAAQSAHTTDRRTQSIGSRFRSTTVPLSKGRAS
jgi:type IV secretion system protein VirB6